MGTNSDMTVTVTTTNTGQTGQTGGTGQTGQTGDTGSPIESLTVLMQLLTQGKKGVDGAPATEGTTATQEVLQLILQTGTDKTTIDITIDNPMLAVPNEQLVSMAIDIIASSGLDDNHPLTILLKTVQDQISTNSNEGEDGDGKMKSTGAGAAHAAGGPGGPIPPHLACAFLGGLVMVALAEILANYAKNQSSMEKEYATLWAKTEGMLKDLAQCMAQNILNKAQAQATSDILQAVMTGIGAGISIGGAGMSMKMLGKAEKDLNALSKLGGKDKEMFQFKQGKATADAQSVGTIASATGSIFTGSVTNIVKAWEALAVGNFDAKEKIMENVQQQLTAMVDKYNTGEADAKKACADALDLLKNMMDALAQAFKGLGGGH